MTAQEILVAMAEIKINHPSNLAAKYFDADYFLSLDSSEQKRFAKIIATCIANPDSSMGAYAMNASDYNDFRTFFERVIRDYHEIAADTEIEQKHDWGHHSNCDLGAIDAKLKDISMRVRVARNMKGFSLPGAMDQHERVSMENTLTAAVKTLIDDPAYGGQYLSLTPGSNYKISDTEFNRRVDAHQMFKDMRGDRHLNGANISTDWPYGRGMYISAQEDFIIWVGEEDHLRIMAIKTGGDLTGLFGRLEQGLKRIESKLPGFSELPDFGFITSCPTNLGSGMRASLHIKLPNLSKQGTDLSQIKSGTKAYGLSVRGADGEHSDAGGGGLVDVSPSARLGVTEKDVMQKLFDGTAALWAEEKKTS